MNENIGTTHSKRLKLPAIQNHYSLKRLRILKKVNLTDVDIEQEKDS